MTLLGTGLLNLIAVGVRVLAGLVLNKIFAVFVGPAGYAVVGAFQNFMGLSAALGTAGLNNGITKYTAEFGDDADMLRRMWSAGFLLSTIAASVLSLAIILFQTELAFFFARDGRYSAFFAWFGVLLLPFVWSGMLLAILNGKKKIRTFVIVNVATSIAGFAVSAVLVRWKGLDGALIALTTNQLVAFLIVLYGCRRETWLRLTQFAGTVDRDAVRKLAGYTLMGLVSACSVALSQLFIRNHLWAEFGGTATGYWQAMLRISDTYLMVITLTLSFYYLPRLSEIKERAELRREILKAYLYVLPLTAAGASLIYLSRIPLTHALFSREFEPMQGLYFWQMIGDFLKIGSWILAFLMIAKARTTFYIVTELLFSVTLVLFTYALSHTYGVEGAVMAFALNYGLYWAVMVIVNRRILVLPD